MCLYLSMWQIDLTKIYEQREYSGREKSEDSRRKISELETKIYSTRIYEKRKALYELNDKT